MTPTERPSLHERPPSIEALVGGQGFSEVLRCGWRACREAIKKTSYGDWIQSALQHGTEFYTSDEDAKLPGWANEELNKKALARATKISEKLRERYSREAEYSVLAWQDRGKKVFFQAKKRYPQDGKITRLYLHVPSATAPDAFLSLCRTSMANGAIKQAKIALNLENYQAESIFDEINNNTLIIYVHGDNPEDINRMMNAIDAACKADPKIWELPERLRPALREGVLKDFLLPLDDQIALVEQIGGASYHHSIYPWLYEEATNGGSRAMNSCDLKTLQKLCAPFRPGVPIPFEKYDLRNRSRHLPALTNP